jgi:hypothetical protein
MLRHNVASSFFPKYVFLYRYFFSCLECSGETRSHEYDRTLMLDTVTSSFTAIFVRPNTWKLSLNFWWYFGFQLNPSITWTHQSRTQVYIQAVLLTIHHSSQVLKFYQLHFFPRPSIPVWFTRLWRSLNPISLLAVADFLRLMWNYTP